MAFLTVEGPGGKPVVAKGDAAGSVRVVVAGADGTPITVYTLPSPQTLFGVAPPDGTQAPASHIISPGGTLPDENLVERFVVLPAPGSVIKARQADGDRGLPWYQRGVEDNVAYSLAGREEQVAGNASLASIAALGKVLDDNSSTTPLGANEEFTGAWVDAMHWVDLRVAVTADVASADAGLVIEQSHDGATVIADDSYTIVAGRKGTFAAQCAARYVRVRYINGPNQQTTFAIQSMLKRSAALGSVHNIGHVQDIAGEDDAQLAISVIAGSSPGGGWRAARVDQFRRLTVATAQESSPLHTTTFGRISVSTVDEMLVVSPAYVEQTTEAQRSLVSTSAQDGPGGTGIRSVVIEYYRADLTGPFFETVTLNGLTPVNTVSSTICYIEKLFAYTAGSPLAKAAGDISLKAAAGGGGATIWSIPTGDRRARGAHHYLSPGSDVHVTATVAGVIGTGSASLYLVFAPILEPNYTWQQVGPAMRVTNDGQAQIVFPSPLNIDGPGRLSMAVVRDSAPSTMVYFGGFSYYHNTDA